MRVLDRYPEVMRDVVTGEILLDREGQPVQVERERWLEVDVVPEADAQARDQQRLAADVRADRNARLQACDWTTLPDVPLSDGQRAAWASYRRRLRDVTAQPGFPAAVEWPHSP